MREASVARRSSKRYSSIFSLNHAISTSTANQGLSRFLLAVNIQVLLTSVAGYSAVAVMNRANLEQAILRTN